MDIIVCIKQVPDARNVRLEPATNTPEARGV
jgi:electron transfer flavoprotein alpha/beta subunit